MRTLLRRAAALALLTAMIVPAALGAAPARKRARPAAAPRAATAAPGRSLVPLGTSAAYDSTLGDSIAEPRLFMAWHAPYGMPGASSNLQLGCRDTVGEDTLYLSFETGRNLEGFYGVSGWLRFHPAEGDTLGPFWHFGPGGTNLGSVRAQLDPDGSFPCSQPWNRSGFGNLAFKNGGMVGEMRFVYAVPVGQTVPVSATQRFCMARIILAHRRCHLAGSDQPVCLEWFDAQYSGGGRDLPIKLGERLVTINSPDGRVSLPYRRTGKVPAWAPRTPKSGAGPDSAGAWEHR
jgi:hypothetical protein